MNESGPKMNAGNEKNPDIVINLQEQMTAEQVMEVQKFITNKPDFVVEDIEKSTLLQSQKNLLGQYLNKRDNPDSNQEIKLPFITSGKWNDPEERLGFKKNPDGTYGNPDDNDAWSGPRQFIFPRD